jgi:hypothetical protein
MVRSFQLQPTAMIQGLSILKICTCLVPLAACPPVFSRMPGVTGGLSAGVFAALAARIEKPWGASPHG